MQTELHAPRQMPGLENRTPNHPSSNSYERLCCASLSHQRKQGRQAPNTVACTGMERARRDHTMNVSNAVNSSMRRSACSVLDRP